MARSTLTIDLDALAANWRDLAQASGSAEAGAVVKADAYGLGAEPVVRRLAKEGARRFFVALAEEGAVVRRTLGPEPEIYVFSGHMAGDTDIIREFRLTPMINAIDQMLRHVEALPGHPFGLQLDTGMNRLGMEPAEWSALRDIALSQGPQVVMSHLACSDDPSHPMNQHQLQVFHEMTGDIDAPRSLAATGGILLGPDYHFEITRPGIGMYGGLPYVDSRPVARLMIPVIQSRDLMSGETVGYGNSWIAQRPTRVATIAAGYADGILRTQSNRGHVYADGVRCPILGRVSMDLIGVDVTHLKSDPTEVELIGTHQSPDTVADAAGTIGYEILTSLGARYTRRYLGQ